MLIVDCQDSCKKMCCPVHSDQQAGLWDVESLMHCQNLMQLDSLNAGCRMYLKFFYVYYHYIIAWQGIVFQVVTFYYIILMETKWKNNLRYKYRQNAAAVNRSIWVAR